MPDEEQKDDVHDDEEGEPERKAEYEEVKLIHDERPDDGHGNGIRPCFLAPKLDHDEGVHDTVEEKIECGEGLSAAAEMLGEGNEVICKKIVWILSHLICHDEPYDVQDALGTHDIKKDAANDLDCGVESLQEQGEVEYGMDLLFFF